MHEMLHWAAGARTPVVMANVNRALGPGWNTWAEHTDAFSQRDTGWLQVSSGPCRRAYDATLMAFRIAEDERVLLPVMVNLDGFTSRTSRSRSRRSRSATSSRRSACPTRSISPIPAGTGP